MSKIDWTQKLSSRKLWALIIVLFTSIGVLFGLDTETVTEVTAMISAFGAVVVYILSEAHVDASRIKGQADVNAALAIAGDCADIESMAKSISDSLEGALKEA